jgi:hypothetical protein
MKYFWYYVLAFAAITSAYRYFKRNSTQSTPSHERVDYFAKAAGDLPQSAESEAPLTDEPQSKKSKRHVVDVDQAPANSYSKSSDVAGDYTYDVVGESFQRDHLTQLIRAHKAFDIGEIFTTATLEPEPTNAFDPTAVKVVVDGIQVGYIPKFDSAQVTKMIAASGKPTKEVKARIGWDEDSPSPFVGVSLIFSLDD